MCHPTQPCPPAPPRCVPPYWQERLDDKFPLLLTTEEMERLGGPTEGYEQVRAPMPSTADFKHRLDLNSADHKEWLEAAGTI